MKAQGVATIQVQHTATLRKGLQLLLAASDRHPRTRA